MSPEKSDPKLVALESALASLAPAAGSLNRDLVLFQAGRAAALKRRWLWPCATASLALFSGALSVFLALSLQAQPPPQVVYVRVGNDPSQAKSQAEPELSPGDFTVSSVDRANPRSAPLSCFHLEQLVQHWGVDALPDSSPAMEGYVTTLSPRTLEAHSGKELAQMADALTY
jgi:hypothetical protein